MQYLYYYKNSNNYFDSPPVESPDVSLILSPKQVIYEDNETFMERYKEQYFTIKSLEDNNEISFIQGTQTTSVVIEVSTDNGSTWVSKSTAASTTTSVVTLNKNQTAIFRGNNNQLGFSYQATGMRISGSKNFEVFGNLLSLVYKDFIGKLNAPTYNYVFSNLFNGNTKLISAENLILPNSKNFGCFYGTFTGCTNLKYAPKKLCESNTTGASSTYANMFNGCINLLTTPILTPTTLTDSCYNSMFYNCKRISTIECHATSMKSNSLNSWMSGVTQSGIFYQQSSATYNTGVSGIPENWQIKYLDTYDSIIEYLIIPQGAYVDSGYIPNNETGMMYECVRTSTSDTYYMGLRETSGNTRFAVNMYSTIAIGWGSYYALSGSYIYSQKTKVEINMYNSRIGGVGTDTKSIPTLPFTPTLTIYIGGANVGYSSSVGKPPQHYFYRAQITQGSELIMDFIPVRVGQIGYMYDKVSGKLFGNSGTGEFILGPDI